MLSRLVALPQNRCDWLLRRNMRHHDLLLHDFGSRWWLMHSWTIRERRSLNLVMLCVFIGGSKDEKLAWEKACVMWENEICVTCVNLCQLHQHYTVITIRSDRNQVNVNNDRTERSEMGYLGPFLFQWGWEKERLVRIHQTWRETTKKLR